MVATLLLATALCGDIVHVEVDGVDAEDRDGLTRETAFRSLAYACERLPEGSNTVRIGPGIHVCTRPAVVPSGTSIFGRGFHGNGDQFSRLVASDSWPLRDAPCDGPTDDETLLVVRKGAVDVTIFGVQFESPEDRRLTGGLSLDASERIKVDTCRFRDFRWFGLQALNCASIEIARCSFRHCSTDRCRHRLGQISTKWLRESSIHHCRLTPHPDGGGYGYKGGGHRGVRIHDNTIETSYFAIESPHENEFGLEIDHNVLNGAVSVPKGGQGADPTKEGYLYSVEIHHNVMTDSYAVEGPRNHLRVHHNHIHINKPNGRVYSQFGGINHGPVRFDHNVIENVDRSIIWVRTGLAEKLTFEANTVFAADAFDRNGLLFSAWSAEHINDWVIRDNVIVASWNQPRKVMQLERDVPSKITFENNLCVNLHDVPDGNRIGLFPQFRRGTAAKPWDYFAPVDENGPTVDAGIREDDDFIGAAPDIGAVEFGSRPDVVGPRRN